MEYQCIKESNHKTSYWSGIIKNIKRNGSYYEMEVNARGSYFHVIFGTHSYGKYVCIPNWEVGCELTDYTDLFWNTERISMQMSIVDAISVATAIKAVIISEVSQ